MTTTKQIKTWEERITPDWKFSKEQFMQAEIDELRAALAQPEQPAQCFTDWWATTDGAPSYQETFEAGRRAQPAKREPLSDELIEATDPTDSFWKRLARANEAEITKGVNHG